MRTVTRGRHDRGFGSTRAVRIGDETGPHGVTTNRRRIQAHRRGERFDDIGNRFIRESLAGELPTFADPSEDGAGLPPMVKTG
jgi:hypothetical protein